MSQSAEKCNLKYLEFFPAAFASVRFYFSTIYNVAKGQAGPLKPGIEDIEEVLRDVLRPVLRAAEDYSRKLLKYIDNKVGEKLKVVDEHITFFMKPIVFHTGQLITEAGRHTFLILRSLGLDSATSSHGIQYEKEVYANASSTSTFEKCISFCLMQQIVRMFCPAAINIAQSFNQFSSSLRVARFPFYRYVPETPTHVLQHLLKASTADDLQTWEAYSCQGTC